MRRSVGRILPLAVLLWAGLLARAGGAGAQDATSTTPVRAPTHARVELEVGPYNAAVGDWPVVGVRVTGDLEPALAFTIMLKGAGDQVLWREDSTFSPPATRLAVTGVRASEVTSADFNSTLVLGQLVVPQLEGQGEAGGGGSTGQVATSMSLVIIVAVILFRTPLPAA
ncbi:MAG: hypothetical protein Q8K72_16365, partial [Acidimicrobiales bacterium]|nr:hypothetical protein [Acidimicrobiales bacterium]